MMSVRFAMVASALVALAACQPTAPDDSRFGVGFDQTFDAQMANRNAALEGGLPPAPVVSAQPLPAAGSAEETAAQTAAILAQTGGFAGAAPQAGGVAPVIASPVIASPVIASPGNAAPPVINATTGISQENNFDAVAGQRTIESDAARIAANRAQYQVIQPQALPERGESGPNIVAFALSTSHPVGTRMYRRSGFNAANRYNRSCSQYRHQDQAQIAFLEAGGPERDRQGMDPDGDGYACTWDPSVYRNVTQ